MTTRRLLSTVVLVPVVMTGGAGADLEPRTVAAYEKYIAGVSRGFPPLLGWIIEPIARRLGRGSAADGLERLRAVLKRRDGDKAPAVDPRWTSRLTTGWCGDADGSIPN